MIPNKHSVLFVLFTLTLISTFIWSCREIQESNFVKGLWQVESIEIDTFTMINRSTPYVRNIINKAYANNGNFLHAFLDGYSANKDVAYYRIDYQRDDIVFTYYNIGDSNVYSSVGKWYLSEPNLLFQRVDKFWDGQFSITKNGFSNYTYKSGRNYVRLLNDTVSMTIKIKRIK